MTNYLKKSSHESNIKDFPASENQNESVSLNNYFSYIDFEVRKGTRSRVLPWQLRNAVEGMAMITQCHVAIRGKSLVSDTVDKLAVLVIFGKTRGAQSDPEVSQDVSKLQS